MRSGRFPLPRGRQHRGCPLPAYAPLWLERLQPDNLTGPVDNFGEREPWIELYNAGSSRLDLSGYYLANNYDSNLTQWPFPAGSSIDPGEFKLIWADGQPARAPHQPAHQLPAQQHHRLRRLVRLLESKPQITGLPDLRRPRGRPLLRDFPDGQPFARSSFIT